VIQFITNEKYNFQARDTFRLFFDLERSTSCTDQFWFAVDSEPQDLVGLRHCSRIAYWFPKGSCIFPLEDRQKIEKRTTDIIKTWIWKTDRRAHDYGNKYIFESFADATGYQCWFRAWREDLFHATSPNRRYFLSSLWSEENIEALRKVYDNISQNMEALHCLIMTGPTKFRLSRLKLDHSLFILSQVDDQNKTSQAQARRCEPVTTLH
jgi:hypothetical protein